MTVEERGYLNIREAAAFLGVSRVTIWRWIRAGKLPASRMGHRTIRIRRDDLVQLMGQRLPADELTPRMGAALNQIEAEDATSDVRQHGTAEQLRDADPLADLEHVLHVLLDVAHQSDQLARLLRLALTALLRDLGPVAARGAPNDLDALSIYAAARALALGEWQAIALPTNVSEGDENPPQRLKHVVASLLENAVKYGPSGAPLDVVVSLATHEVVELSVPTRGVGLPLGQRIQHLERCYRDHTDSHAHGLGLGQHISRQIADLHGGEVWVEFSPEGEARFVVRLPFPEGDSAQCTEQARRERE